MENYILMPSIREERGHLGQNYILRLSLVVFLFSNIFYVDGGIFLSTSPIFVNFPFENKGVMTFLKK
jgi:hypothetical protein